jgi:hydroxymethylglutaryl-CoA synthase
MAGIVGYGAYIPRMRITVEEIAAAWQKDGKKIGMGIGVQEKAVARDDEDSCTMSVEAGRKAVALAGIDATEIGAVYVGSESHPYAVKPTATIVGEALNVGPDMMCADLEFACKAGTAGVQMCLGLVKSDMVEYGLAIGADTAQGKPNDALEYTAASGAGALLIGDKKEEVIAEINHTLSFTTDTPDFWRRPKAEFPSHAGRFTGEPAYFKHVLNCAERTMAVAGTTVKDYDHAVFHQPNGKFPSNAAKMLGIDKEKIKQGLLVPQIGNTYSGATMIGLCSVLDVAQPGDRVLAVSYGSGSGSDGFDITITKNIQKKRQKERVWDLAAQKEYISYAAYAKHRKKLKAV